MKKLSLLAALLLCCFLCTAGTLSKSRSCSEQQGVPRYIIHAGGTLWGYDTNGSYTSFAGSNSLEGLEQCADAGMTAVELDFSFTKDGYLACIHDWSPRFSENITPNEPLTLDEFLDTEIYGAFTPLSLDDVVQFLGENEDITIVTDIKENFAEAVRVLSETDLTDRFIVQIYREEEYDIVREYGFERVIYTLYRLDWSEKTDTAEISDFAETHELAGIAFDKDLCDVDGFVNELKQIGVPLYVYTVNDDIERYFVMGISGIYTDEVSRRK